MTKHPQAPELDAILDEFAGLPNPPDAETLRTWLQRYPQFADEIIDFATDWVEMEAAPVLQPSSDEVDVVVNRTMSRVQALLDAAERPEKLTDLAADIRAAGHDLETFQRIVGIDRSMLDTIIAHLVRPATVPALLTRSISVAIGRSIDTVRDYMCLPPVLGAAHRSRGRPQASQIDFSLLVKHSQLSEAEKRGWLAEPPDRVLKERSDG